LEVVGLSVMARVLILLLLLSSCATVEVLDGLCYNDKEGSHLCEKHNTWEKCKPWLTHDGEVWANCMLMYA
jgi:hypothetical protein